MQCQAGAWLAQRYKLLQQLFQDGPMEYWQAQWQDPAGYGGEATLQIPLPIFLQHPERLQQWQDQQHYIHPLQHPNVLRLYELGQEQDLHFLASEPLEGVTIYQVIQHFRIMKQGLPWPIAAHVVARICEGLHFAHTCPSPVGDAIYHGDLRPENVLLTSHGEIKVQRFGHLNLWGDLREAWPIQIKRRYAYAAPERWQESEPFSPAADLYSIGVMLYELLALSLPFDGNTIEAIQKSMLAPLGTTLHQGRSDIPKTLSDLCAQLLHPTPSHRLTYAKDVQSLIDNVLRSQGQQPVARDLRSLCEQVMPKGEPGSAPSAPVDANPMLSMLEEDPDDYFADDVAPPTLIAGASQKSSFGFPVSKPDWDPFEGEDYEEEDPGESTRIQPNLLLEFQRSMQEGKAPEEEVKLSLNSLDPRSRDDLEAPDDIFAIELAGTDIHPSAPDLPAVPLSFGTDGLDAVEDEDSIPILDLDDPDSVIELDDSDLELIDALDIEELDDIEEINEIEEIHEIDGLEVIEEFEEIDLGQEMNDIDLGEATFLQGAPLPSWGKGKGDDGPATIQGGLDPSTMALLAQAEADHKAGKPWSPPPAPVPNRAAPAVATIRPPSSDSLAAQRQGMVRTHSINDLQPKNTATPTFQLEEALTKAPEAVHGVYQPTPMDLGSLGGGRTAPSSALLPAHAPPKKSKVWLLVLLLPLVGGGGGTGAWFLYQMLQGPPASVSDAGARAGTHTTFPPSPAPRQMVPTRVVVDASAPTTPDVDNTPMPNIRPMDLMRPTPRRRTSRRRYPVRRRGRRPRPRRRTKRPQPRPRLVARAAPRIAPVVPAGKGKTGALIFIKPSCTVFIGRDIKGSSTPPLKLGLAPGSYNFRCFDRAQRIQHRFRLRIEQNKVFKYTRTLRAGKLLVRANPWGTIHADGFGKIGKTGTTLKLYQGTFNLTLFKKGSTVPGPGMRKTMRVTIRPNKVTKPALYKFPVLDDDE